MTTKGTKDLTPRTGIKVFHNHQAVVPGGEFQVVYNMIPENQNLVGLAADKAAARMLFDEEEWEEENEYVNHPEPGLVVGLLSKLKCREDGGERKCDARRRWQPRTLLECITGGVESTRRQKELADKFLDGRSPLHVSHGPEMLTLFATSLLDEDVPEPGKGQTIAFWQRGLEAASASLLGELLDQWKAQPHMNRFAIASALKEAAEAAEAQADLAEWSATGAREEGAEEVAEAEAAAKAAAAARTAAEDAEQVAVVGALLD